MPTSPKRSPRKRQSPSPKLETAEKVGEGHALYTPVRWEMIEQGVSCRECGHPSMNCFKSERDDMTWDKPVQKQSRRCPKCRATRHTFYFIAN